MAADAAVTFLLEKLTGIIVGYADLITGASNEFKELQKFVRLLQSNLKDLSSASSKDHTVREMQDQVREVVYEVEDTIDSWLTEAAEVKGKGKVKCFAKWFSPTHFSLANDVKTLREGKVKEIYDKVTQLRSVVGKTKEEDANVIKKDPPLRSLKVVPVKDAESTIIDYLMKPQKKLDIIPIIGMGGLGKTTMVGKIYNDERIYKEFPLRIWVHFSQRFNSHEVFVKIMDQINKGNNEAMSSKTDRELSDIVRGCLDGEKFLMVFDDVWEEHHWDGIREALPYNNCRGKVLLTSRNMDVGTSAHIFTKPYVHQPLGIKESWELLQYEVFGDLEICPKELQGFGQHIAYKKCKGVPLTISVMGGVLRHHYFNFEKSLVKVKKKWEEMSGSGNLALKDQVKVIDAVAMSYNSLPDNLRDCFLYLGVFPEGYDIPSWILTSLWIAEGFIKPEDNKSLEEIAMDNLDKLVSRNLLMALKRNSMQEVKLCGVQVKFKSKWPTRPVLFIIQKESN